MARYYVEITHKYYVMVEAKSAEDAENKVEDRLERGEIVLTNPDTYSIVADPDAYSTDEED